MDINFEEMLRNGTSTDDLLNQMRTRIAEADAKIKAEEEAKRKEQAAKQAATETEAKAKALVDLGNRAMSNSITAADVAYIEQLYAAQKYPEHTSMLAQVFTPEEVDNTITMALETINVFRPLLDFLGIKNWDEIINSMSPEDLKKIHKDANAKAMADHKSSLDRKLSDDQILHNFIRNLK